MPSVSEPWSVREAADALRQAAAEGRTVSIDREGGAVVLSSARLDQVLEHEAGDLTCTVEAGVRVRELNAQLAERGQMLALDPPGNPTVGACLAGDLSGPRRHRYGTSRDLVLGVTVVLPDGTIASSGGKVVKNVAGYDLGKLFCGSHGRLGFVARASLRLHPRPETERTLVVPATEPAAAQRLWELVHRSALVPSAVDLLWPGWLALLFEGSARAVGTQLAKAQELVGGQLDFGSAWDEAAARQEWAQGRVRLRPGALAAALERLSEALVRISAGIAYTPEPAPEEVPEALSALLERVRTQFDPQRVLV